MSVPESPSSTFQQTLENIREYLEKLLFRKPKKVLKKEEKSPGEKGFLRDIFEKIRQTTHKSEEQGPTSDETKPREEIAPEDQEEYIPNDFEFGESLGEAGRFAEVSPAYTGYYTQGKKSYFDPASNLWSKKKKLVPYSAIPDTQKKKYSYAINLKSGRIALPLPEGCIIDTHTCYFTGHNAPQFSQDQYGCMYIDCLEPSQKVSFTFYSGQVKSSLASIPADSEKIVFEKLTHQTASILSGNVGTHLEKANNIKSHILRTKKYSTKVQGTLHQKSNARNYVTNIDASPILECFSANTLFVALCREVGIPARLIVGHMVQSPDKEGKALISKNNGHAWSEIWDGGEWIRFDATPTTKEDGEKSEQNMDEKEKSGEVSESNMDQSEQGKEQSEQGSGDMPPGERGAGGIGGDTQREESGDPKKLLDDLIKKSKDDSLAKQSDAMEETLKKLEQAKNTKEMKDALEKSGLKDEAKEMIDQVGNKEILEKEKEVLEKAKEVGDEKALEQTIKESLLDPEYKKKLQEYGDVLRKQIEEAKKKLKSEMERMGFNEEELQLYHAYKALEREVEPEIRRQIHALENILPPKYKVQDDSTRYKSGPQFNTPALVNFIVEGDPHVFRRTREVRDPSVINMYEAIIIDRSGSMGNFKSQSPLRESVKAGIIRAKVLEHFKVDFAILFFDDGVEEVMSFGEKFSERKKCAVPSRLMRAVQKSGGTNISAPLSYTLTEMKKQRQKLGGKHFGNITFIGDGGAQTGLTGQALTDLVNQLRQEGFGVTAYYLSGGSQNGAALEQYFGKKESGGTVVVSNISELTSSLIGAYNKGLRKILQRFTG